MPSVSLFPRKCSSIQRIVLVGLILVATSLCIVWWNLTKPVTQNPNVPGGHVIPPAGTYTAHTKVLGTQIDGTVHIDEQSSFDLHMTSPVSIDCGSGNHFAVDPNTGALVFTLSSCVTGTLEKYNVKITQIGYNPTSTTLSITLVYMNVFHLVVPLVLQH